MPPQLHRNPRRNLATFGKLIGGGTPFASSASAATVEAPSSDTANEARARAALLITGALVRDEFSLLRIVGDRAADVDGGRVYAIGDGRQLVREVPETAPSDPDWYLPNTADNPDAVAVPAKADRRAAVVARYPQLASATLQAALIEQSNRTIWGADGVFDFAGMNADAIALQAALASPLSTTVLLSRSYQTNWCTVGFGEVNLIAAKGNEVRRMGTGASFPANRALRFFDELGPIAGGYPFLEERYYGSPDALDIRDFGVDGTGPYFTVSTTTAPTALVGTRIMARVGVNPQDSNEPWLYHRCGVVSVSGPLTEHGETVYRLYLEVPVDGHIPTQRLEVSTVINNGDGTQRVIFVNDLEFSLKVHDPFLTEGSGTEPPLNTTKLWFEKPDGSVTIADFWDPYGHASPRVVGVPLAASEKNRSNAIGDSQIIINNPVDIIGEPRLVAVGDEIVLGQAGAVFSLLTSPEVRITGTLHVTQDDPTAAFGNLVDCFGGETFVADGLVGGQANRLLGFTGMTYGRVETLELGKQLNAIGNSVVVDVQSSRQFEFGQLRVREGTNVALDQEGGLVVIRGGLIDVTLADAADFPRSLLNWSVEGGAVRIGQVKVSGGTPDAADYGRVPVSIMGVGDISGAGFIEDVEIGTAIYEGPYKAMRTDLVTGRIHYTDEAEGDERRYSLRKRHRVTATVAGTEKLRLGFAGVPRAVSIHVDSASDRAGLQAQLDAGTVLASLIRRGASGSATFAQHITPGREIPLDAGRGVSNVAYTIYGGTRFADEFEVVFYDNTTPLPDDTVVSYDVEYWTSEELLALEDPTDATSPILFSHRLYTEVPPAETYVPPADSFVTLRYVADPNNGVGGETGPTLPYTIPAASIDLATGQFTIPSYVWTIPLSNIDPSPLGLQNYSFAVGFHPLKGHNDRPMMARCLPLDAAAAGNPTGVDAVQITIHNLDTSSSRGVAVGVFVIDARRPA